MSTPSGQQNLVLRTVTHPNPAIREAYFFVNEQKALEHLQNHLLTSPENEAWALVLADLGQAEIAETLKDSEACFRLIRLAGEAGAAAVSEYLEAYRKAVNQGCVEARKLGWWAQDRWVAVAIGTTAVFALFENSVLRTAYIPAQAVKNRKREPGTVTPLPPAHKMRKPREKERDRKAAEREAQWTALERIYYKLFRPAVQFIRSRYHTWVSLNGQKWDDIALLKDRLPRMSQLSYAKWYEYHQQVR